jgi:hypothetical protein
MNIQTIQHFQQSAMYALLASVAALSVLFIGFFLAEPAISHGQEDTSTFTIQQTITGESSFTVPPTDVTMAGSINGLTGGNATGTTQFVVTSNNSSGYYVEIAFFDNGNGAALAGDVTGSNALRDYDGDNVGEPSKNWSASTSAQFAYTVTSSSSADTDPSFFHDGGANCNTGSLQTSYCWKAPAVAGFRIVDTSDAALTGATSSVQFKINVPNAAAPSPQAETYTATATLSLFVK